MVLGNKILKSKSTRNNFGGIHYLFNGNADDENGNYHGSPVNITYGGSGDEQYAIFNGTTSYIDTGYFLPDGSVGNDYTLFISFRRNILDPNTPSRPFSTTGGGSETRGLLCAVGSVTDKLNVGCYTPAGNGGMYTTDFVIAGEFNDLVLVSRDGILHLYLNGAHQAQFTPWAHVVSNGSLALGLAYRFIPIDDHNWNGDIRECLIVERALTETEIQLL